MPTIPTRASYQPGDVLLVKFPKDVAFQSIDPHRKTQCAIDRAGLRSDGLMQCDRSLLLRRPIALGSTDTS